jgi:hypothetical protein
MEKLGHPENQINALGVHYANCVDLNYPGARITLVQADAGCQTSPHNVASGFLIHRFALLIDRRADLPDATPPATSPSTQTEQHCAIK